MAEQWMRQKLSAEFLSDAHLGSGSGGGGIDSLVARDRHDRPVIWASHIEGVLRDAARRLHGDREAEAFFGRGGGDHARGDRQRAVFTSLYAKHCPEMRLWRSTARAAFDNRAPMDDTLRTIEHVPKGTRFEGEVELPEGQLGTLRRLVKEVDAVGSGRAAGAGRVALTLTDVSAAQCPIGTATGRLLLLLKNRDPLCITATATPDNLIPSLAFVPGRALLGAVAAWLIAEGHRETAALLTSGRVSVSDALPLPEAPLKLDEAVVLPAPLSLQSEKPQGAAGGVPWWAQSAVPISRRDTWNPQGKEPQQGAKLKRPEDDLFVYRAAPSAAWTAFRPRGRVRLRNGRADPTQADPSLFAIEQIVEDTHFLSELQGPAADLQALVAALAPVLEGRRWLRVGRGGAPVEVVRLTWAGAPPAAKTEDKALLTLTSDLLVRDGYLRWRTELDKDALIEVLGGDIQLGRSLQDTVMVHGFNGTARLWRMPAAAIRRGSVFEISGPGVSALEDRALQGDWLGERTHEGFGRFRIDTTLPGETHAVVSSHSPAPVADAAEEAIAETTQRWFEDHPDLARFDKKVGHGQRPPSLSQWLDLVGELKARNPGALTSRLNPTTAGGKSWKHPDAKAILDALANIQAAQQQTYAQLFVRWLRAEARRGTGKTP